MDQVVAQALTTYNQITTKPVIELVENVNGSASNPALEWSDRDPSHTFSRSRCCQRQRQRQRQIG